MTTLFLIRHGETEWNRNGRWQGHADIPLSDEGRDQAKRLAQRLVAEGQQFDQIYASDLGRAFETASIIAGAFGLPVHPLIELREIHIGTWSGLTSTEIRTRFPDEWALFEAKRDFPRGTHGETMADFRGRAARVVVDLVRKHPGERLLIVTHGGVVRAMLHYVSSFTGESHEIHIENTSITELHFQDGRPHVVRSNDAAHLGQVEGVDQPGPV